MVVEVDLQSLKRYWYLPGGHLQFLLKVDFGAEILELDDLLEIAADIRHRLSTNGGRNPADAEGWVRTKAGWSGVLTGAHTIDDGLEWLELFTATWGGAFDGKVVGGPPSRRPSLQIVDPELTAFLAYTTGDLNTIPSDDRGPLWFVDDTITRYLAESAITWAYTRGCRQYLRRSDWWVEPIGLDHALAIAQGINRYTSCRLVSSQIDPPRYRHAIFQPQGNVTFQVVDPTVDWQTRLDQLRETLTWTPPHTDLAFVRYDTGNTPLWFSDVLPWPHVDEAEVRYNRPLLASFVPDVNGIQLLTDAHLKRAHDLSDWRIETLAGGRHLVEARDLEPWYAQLEPDPAVLTKARRDFGDMILTTELIEANNPWHD